MDRIAWHYTIGHRFVQIVEDGFLRPTGAHIASGEKPVLWFSLHPTFEPTARKAIREGGKVRTLSMDETRELGGNLVRFGVLLAGLLVGENLRKRARIHPMMWQALARVGRQQGADPAQWAGSLTPVAVHDCIVEVMGAEGAWERVQEPAQAMVA